MVPGLYLRIWLTLLQGERDDGGAVDVWRHLGFLEADVAPKRGCQRFVDGFFDDEADQDRCPVAFGGELLDSVELGVSEHPIGDAGALWPEVFEVDPNRTVLGAGSEGHGEVALVGDRYGQAAPVHRCAPVVLQQGAGVAVEVLEGGTSGEASTHEVDPAIAPQCAGEVPLLRVEALEHIVGHVLPLTWKSYPHEDPVGKRVAKVDVESWHRRGVSRCLHARRGLQYGGAVIARMLLFLIVCSWPAATAADPVEEAERARLLQELEQLSARERWSGVERRFQQLVALGGDLEEQAWFRGAEAAWNQGEIALAHERLKRTVALGNREEARRLLGEIDTTYAQVQLSTVPRQGCALDVNEQPFDPVQRSAVESAKESTEETGAFAGMLPGGDYTFCGRAFSVVPGMAIQVEVSGKKRNKGR